MILDSRRRRPRPVCGRNSQSQVDHLYVCFGTCSNNQLGAVIQHRAAGLEGREMTGKKGFCEEKVKKRKSAYEAGLEVNWHESGGEADGFATHCHSDSQPQQAGLGTPWHALARPGTLASTA